MVIAALLAVAGWLIYQMRAGVEPVKPDRPSTGEASAERPNAIDIDSPTIHGREAVERDSTKAQSLLPVGVDFPVTDGSAEAREELVSLLFGPITELDETDRSDMLSFALRWGSIGRTRTADLDLKEIEFNPQGKALTKGQEAFVKSILAPYDETLAQQGEASFLLLKAASVAYWEQRRFEIVTTGIPETAQPEDAEKCLYDRRFKIGHRGWVAYVRFRSADFPYFEESLKEIVRVRVQRANVLRTYLDQM